MGWIESRNDLIVSMNCYLPYPHMTGRRTCCSESRLALNTQRYNIVVCPCRVTRVDLWCVSVMGLTMWSVLWAGATAAERSTNPVSTPTLANLSTGFLIIYSRKNGHTVVYMRHQDMLPHYWLLYCFINNTLFFCNKMCYNKKDCQSSHSTHTLPQMF